ncbi:MAG TPA: hypothetical protein VI893_03340, partial [Thermoplasmata archaeon]|nr:hypothetical protein [Thermoplasmata archaeon]
ISWRSDRAGVTIITVTGGGGGQGNSLAGVHWYSGDSSLLDANRPPGSRGWNIEAIYGVEDLGSRDHAKTMAQRAKDHGLVNIVRIDYRNGQAVPMVSTEFKSWGDRFIDRTRDFAGVSSMFVVGNEPTIEPSGGTSAAEYASAFDYLFSRRGEMPAGTTLLFAGPAAFSWDQRGNRNFLDWLEDASNRITALDGFALHAYGDPSVGGCEDPRRACARNGWPFDGGFQTFKQQIDRVAKKWKAAKPVYLTEFNTDVNGRGAWPDPSDNYRDGWINQAFESVRDYNSNRGTTKPPVRSLCWFVDRDDGGWGKFSLRSIGTARDDMRDEFRKGANSVTSDGEPELGGGTAGGPIQGGADWGEVAPWVQDRLTVGIAMLTRDSGLLLYVLLACALASSSILIYRRTGGTGRSRRRVPRPTARAPR